MKTKIFRKLSYLTIVAMLLSFFWPLSANAAALTALSDTMSRLKVSTASNHTIKYTTPTGVAAAGTMTVTFDSGFTIGTVDYTDIDVSWGPTTGAENELTLAATAATTTWGAAFAGQVLTITSGTGTIAAASVVNIEIGTNATYGVAGDQQITNPATTGSKTISIAGTFGDTGTIAVAIVTDDQVTVSATVGNSITFVVNVTSVNLGALSTASVSTGTTNFDVTTNASTGYGVTITEDGNLRVGANDINDVTDGTVTAGSEEYGASTSKAGQTIVQTGANAATAIDDTNKSCASSTGPVSADNTVLTYLASISGATPAGSYSHITTLIATGNF